MSQRTRQPAGVALTICIELRVNSAAEPELGCLHHAFRKRRMGMDCLGYLFNGRLEAHRKRGFSDEVGGAGSYDVRAEHLAGAGIGDDFEKSIGRVERPRAAKRPEWILNRFHFQSLLLGLLDGKPDGADFRMSENARGHDAIINALVLGRALRDTP